MCIQRSHKMVTFLSKLSVKNINGYTQENKNDAKHDKCPLKDNLVD